MYHEILEAIAENQFFLEYQPYIDVESKKTVGLEALIRWNHPTKGILTPNEFIPHAEENSLIIHIEKWVLSHGIHQGKKWLEKGIPKVNIAFNISPRHLLSDVIFQNITQAIGAESSLPFTIELEMTERSEVKDLHQMAHRMNKLKDTFPWLHINIDDFGAGYNSIKYIKHLPIDRIKIDRYYLEDICNSQTDQAILNGIVHIANQLDIEIIAEGVETKEQLGLLENSSCHLAQGFYICKPISADEIEDFLISTT